MKTKILFLLPLLFFGLTAQAQTKKIAHKSHSGKMVNFSLTGFDDFGLPCELEMARLAKQDSLKKAKLNKPCPKNDSLQNKTPVKINTETYKVIPDYKPIPKNSPQKKSPPNQEAKLPESGAVLGMSYLHR